MKDAIKMSILFFFYPAAMFLYVFFCGYPPLSESIAIIASVPLVFFAVLKI